MTSLSSVIGTVTNAGNAVSTIAGILGFGSSGPVSIGSVTLQGFEVPETISFGGQQQITVHKLVGGDRVIDVMGPDAHPIKWSGLFFGSNASQRAAALDKLRLAGNVVTLHWSTFMFSVVIDDFSADYRFGRISYRISCTVLGIPKPPTQTPIGSTSGLLADVNSALSTVNGVVSTAQSVASQATAALNAVASVIPGAATLVAKSTAALGVITNLQTASGALTGGIASAEGVMSSISSGAVTGGIMSSVTNLASSVSSAANQAQMTLANSFVGRALFNAENTST